MVCSIVKLVIGITNKEFDLSRLSRLNMAAQSIPPGQFTVVDTKTVLGKLLCLQEGAIHIYGLGVFRWVSSVGDLSAMYEEVDPSLACDKAEIAISRLLKWTGGRLCL